MKTMQINKNQLIAPMDMEIVPFGYKKSLENMYFLYL